MHYINVLLTYLLKLIDSNLLANCLICSYALIEYVILFCCSSFGCVLLAGCYHRGSTDRK